MLSSPIHTPRWRRWVQTSAPNSHFFSMRARSTPAVSAGWFVRWPHPTEPGIQWSSTVLRVVHYVVAVCIMETTPISLPLALTAIRVVWRVIPDRTNKFSVPTPSPVVPRTEREWWSILARRCARLEELRSLNAPDILIENEKRLILDARISLCYFRARVTKPS